LGRIVSVDEASISVSRLMMGADANTMRDFFLPPLIYDESFIDITPKPSLSSLIIIVHHEEDFLSFKARYVFGMQDVFCTREPVNLRYPPQSLNTIIFDGISWLVSELHRVLSSRRQIQEKFASYSVCSLVLLWDYLKEKLEIPVVTEGKTYTFSVSMGRDLSITKVKVP
jgi:RNAse (barnase) inhibitor barstar